MREATVKPISIVAAVAAVFILASTVHAQEEVCDTTQSPLACTDAFLLKAEGQVPAMVEQKKAAAQTETNAALAEAQTGTNSGGSATAATFNDLSPLFEALGLLSEGDQDGGKLALNLNFLLPVQDVENRNSQLKLLINTQPTPFETLVESFDESIREARRKELQKDIPALADAQLSFTWSLVNRRFGRDFRMLRPIVSPLIDGAVARGRASVRQANVNLPQELQSRFGISLLDARTKSIDELARDDDAGKAEAKKKALVQVAVAAAQTRLDTFQAIGNELNRTGLDQLAALVEQNPQLLFSLNHDIRDELVGPEKASATITWEMSRRNLSAFLHGVGKSCSTPEVSDAASGAYASCMSALRQYVGDGGINLKNQWRFKLAASYKRVKGAHYSYPADGIDLTLPETDRWEVAVGAGRPIASKTGTDRLDFELSYDSNIDDDTSNKERLKASLTYTRQLGDMDLPFSIVYANKNEYLGQVDHQISMNVGLKFRND
jgi:hypothetical protein